MTKRALVGAVAGLIILQCCSDSDDCFEYCLDSVALMLDDFEDGDDVINQYAAGEFENCATPPLEGNCTDGAIDGKWFFYDDETEGTFKDEPYSGRGIRYWLKQKENRRR